MARKNVIDELIVTAQKRETRLQETPITINAFTGKMLEDSDIQNLSQLQSFVPGLMVQTQTFGAIYIRGIGSTTLGVGSDASSTLHIDGVYIPRLSGIFSDFWDVDRIEVLKGPQGTLYGRNATGGTINIISKQPTDEFELSVGLTAGNYNKWRLDASIAGPITGTVSGRFTVMKNDRDGFQKDIDQLQRRYMDEDVIAMRGTLEFQLSENGELLLRGDYMRQRETGSTFVEDQLDRPNDTYRVSLDGPQNHDIDGGGVAAILNVDLGQALGGVTWETLASWRKSNVELGFDNDGSGIFKRSSFFPEKTESFHFETRLVSNLDASGRLEWIVGTFYFQEQAEDEFSRLTLPNGPDCLQAVVPDPDPAVCPVTRFAFPEKNETNAIAGFGQATYSFTDQLQFTVGIRYSHEKKEFNSDFHINGNSQFGGFIPEEASWNAWTPKFIVDYHINDNIMLWGSASRGFKSGFFGIGSLGKGPSGQETISAYEMGIKSTLLDGRMIANLSAFTWDYDGLQVQGTDSNTGEFFLDNAGKASNDGIELEIFATPSDRWDINFAVAYLDAVYDLFIEPNSGFDFSGNRQPQSPEWSFAAGATYTTPLRLGDLSFRGEYTWQDDYFYGRDNVFFSEAFGFLNASIIFVPSASKRWTLALFAKNILDEATYFGRFDNSRYSSTPDNSNQVVVGEPRQWGLRIRYDY